MASFEPDTGLVVNTMRGTVHRPGCDVVTRTAARSGPWLAPWKGVAMKDDDKACGYCRPDLDAARAALASEPDRETLRPVVRGLTDACPNDCGDHCGNPPWTREDQDARTDRLRPLAEHLRIGHDVPDDQRRYNDTWLHIALLADEWFNNPMFELNSLERAIIQQIAGDADPADVLDRLRSAGFKVARDYQRRSGQ